MDPNDYIFPAFYVVTMLVGALNPKALAMCIVFAIGLSAVYPDVSKAGFMAVFLLPFVLLANYRD